MPINFAREAALKQRAAVAQRELRRIRRELQEQEDAPFGRDQQEDGMLRQAMPHGTGGRHARD